MSKTSVDPFELLEIPDRASGADREPIEGLALTDEHRQALEIEERSIPGPPGAPDLRVLCYRPRAAEGTLPLLLSLHGGAFCLLSPDSFAGMDAGFALSFGCQVVSVDYRLAPEHPFPAAIEDCWAALNWAATTESLDVDRGRIAVVGASAGGALAAALCQMTRDRRGPAIRFQALFIPVTDDRMETASMRQPFKDESLEAFNGRAAKGMWMHYLGVDRDPAKTSPYAAPMRASSFEDLPPACVLTYGLDPLRDEGIQYAMALMAAGVDVELHNCPGAEHGGKMLNPEAAGRSMQVLNGALAQALAG